ncbi:MAG: hypothetical protein WD894_07955 [Pirellulales bacterium]
MSDILEVASQTEQYVGSAERWKADHRSAMVCYEVEETLALGNRVFDAIVEFDENWRRQVSRGKLRFSPVLHSFIQALFERWHAPCSNVLAAIEDLRHEGFLPKGADEFQHRCREADGILTPDGDFFVGDQLIQIRDDALDQHLRGETLERGPGYGIGLDRTPTTIHSSARSD